MSFWECDTVLRLFDDPCKIQKRLRAADVDPHQSRLRLPSNSVRNGVLPILMNHELDSGIEIKFWDVDTMSLHTLVLKEWTTFKGFVLIGNWTRDFITRRQLMEGDTIGLQWDKFNHRFNFSVLSRASSSHVA